MGYVQKTMPLSGFNVSWSVFSVSWSGFSWSCGGFSPSWSYSENTWSLSGFSALSSHVLLSSCRKIIHTVKAQNHPGDP